MNTNLPSSRTPLVQAQAPAVFLVLTLAVYTTAWLLSARLSELDASQVVAYGLTLDLVFVVPLAFYFLVLRRRGVTFFAVAPLALVGGLVASRVLPADHQGLLSALGVLLPPLELGIVGLIFWRARQAWAGQRNSVGADPLEKLRLAAVDVMGSNRAAEILAFELAALWYLFGSWRSTPHHPPRCQVFRHHRRSNHGAIAATVLLVLAIEGVGLHLLVARWSSVGAWLLSAGTMWGALWLLADWRAMVLRPLLVSGDELVLRAGLRFTLRTPLANIRTISNQLPGPDIPARDRYRLSLLMPPSHWIVFREPVMAQGPYGMRRAVRAVGLVLDEPEELTGRLTG